MDAPAGCFGAAILLANSRRDVPVPYLVTGAGMSLPTGSAPKRVVAIVVGDEVGDGVVAIVVGVEVGAGVVETGGAGVVDTGGVGLGVVGLGAVGLGVGGLGVVGVGVVWPEGGTVVAGALRASTLVSSRSKRHWSYALSFSNEFMGAAK